MPRTSLKWASPGTWAIVWTVAAVLAVQAVQAERPRIYAITNVRIVVAPGQALDNATIVLRDGLIEAVGSEVTAPPDAQIIEGEDGWVVYPALIDAAANLAIKAEEQDSSGPPNFASIMASMARGREDRPGSPHELSVVTPEYAVVDNLDFKDTKIEKHRKMGFGIAHVIPTKGVIRGQSAVIALRSGEPRELIIRDRLVQVAALGSGGFFSFEYPGSKMGAVAAIRQALLDARQQATWLERYEANPVGMARPDFRASDSSLISVTEGKTPLLFVARSTLDHGRFHVLAEEFDLQSMTLGLGCQEEALRLRAGQMPILLPLQFPKKPKVDDEEALRETNLKAMQDYLRAPRLPQELLDGEGQDVAFVTANMETVSDFPRNLQKIVEGGLSEEQALASLTTIPARLLGISETVGTLEKGKVANVLVVNGDLFAEKPEIRFLFVDGRHEEFEAAEAKGDPSAVVDPRGTWEVSTEVMGRSNESTWVIEGSEGDYRGSSEGARGKRDFESVELEGDALTVRISAPMGVLEATVIISGDTLEGESSIQTPQGSMSLKITGKRVSGPNGTR